MGAGWGLSGRNHKPNANVAEGKRCSEKGRVAPKGSVECVSCPCMLDGVSQQPHLSPVGFEIITLPFFVAFNANNLV